MDSRLKSKAKILVADDSADVRTIVHSVLIDDGYLNIYQADSGPTAVEMAIKRKVDLIICDWNMPGANGLEVLTVLRETDVHRNTPFILLTSESYEENVKSALERGVSRYLLKPFRPSQLSEIMQELLKAKFGI